MNEDRRGKIINRGRAKQINDFSGLRYGNITPTDIDGLIEYHNEKHVFFEVKFDEAEMPEGQRMAITRLCKDVYPKPAIFVVVEHRIADCGMDVPVADCTVREFYSNETRKWHKFTGTLKSLTDKFLLSTRSSGTV